MLYFCFGLRELKIRYSVSVQEDLREFANPIFLSFVFKYEEIEAR